jgi:hypothetical protein
MSYEYGHSYNYSSIYNATHMIKLEKYKPICLVLKANLHKGYVKKFSVTLLLFVTEIQSEYCINFLLTKLPAYFKSINRRCTAHSTLIFFTLICVWLIKLK